MFLMFYRIVIKINHQLLDKTLPEAQIYLNNEHIFAGLKHSPKEQ